MEEKTITILGVPIHDIDENHLTSHLREWLLGNEQKIVVTPNPEFILLAQKDLYFRDILKQADLSLPDGVGLRFAVAALTDTFLHFRHTGVDTLEILVQVCEETEKKILLFGGEKGSEQITAERLQKKYPKLKIKAIDPGKIVLEESLGTIPGLSLRPEIIASIQAFAPDVMVVALGGKKGKQEKFMHFFLKEFFTVKIMMGVGGAFDMIAGNFPRAPKWMRQSGLEWMWRLWIQPRRWQRILGASVRFPLLVASTTIKNHRFLKACWQVFPEVCKQLMSKK